jgi:hypothetical protein
MGMNLSNATPLMHGTAMKNKVKYEEFKYIPRSTVKLESLCIS